jgi:hypothetical protein
MEPSEDHEVSVQSTADTLSRAPTGRSPSSTGSLLIELISVTLAISIVDRIGFHAVGVCDDAYTSMSFSKATCIRLVLATLYQERLYIADIWRAVAWVSAMVTLAGVSRMTPQSCHY